MLRRVRRLAIPGRCASLAAAAQLARSPLVRRWVTRVRDSDMGLTVGTLRTETKPMRSLIALASGLIVLVLATYIGFEQPGWMPGVEKESERVLVFLVGSRVGVDRVRKAVDPARIVADGPDALALVEGRIVAVDSAAVSAPFTAAGWIDREIELLHVERREPGYRQSQVAGGEVDPARMARLRDLVDQPSLSAGEQLFVLQAMNDGVAF
jgi:hypothetical protein